MTTQKPLFITFEGGEGAGKGTQIQMLCEYLTSIGIEYITTREPGGCIEAETLRHLLVRDSDCHWTDFSELMLMLIARHEHLEKVIRPALADGKWVICDRFMDSTMAYQGYARGLPPSLIDFKNNEIVAGTISGATFLLDIDPKVGIPRSRGKIQDDGQVNQETRFENLDFSFHEKVREGYLQIAKQNPERIFTINADMKIDAVFAEIKRCLNRIFR